MSAERIQVFAVIPAAGQSTRMGRPKQLLPLSSRTMLESVIETVLAGGIDGLCVVTHPAVDEELALSEDPRFLTAINGDPRSEMLDSVLIGINALRTRCSLCDDDAILVCPGDAAKIAPNNVQACAGEYRRNAGSIVVAAHDGRRGHPIVFPASLEADLREHLEGGLRALLDRRPDDVRLVDCASPGVLMDIDTPEDYARVPQ